MGVVFRAVDVNLDRKVALKVLLPALSLDYTAKARFMQEAKSASMRDHVNIGTVYEVGETDESRIFIAMAFYPGGSLREKVVPGGIALNEALELTAQVASGLDAAHTAGIIHRDIKPGNAVLSADGVVKIVDFGLAKVSGIDITQTGATIGTLAYMSPEQLRGEKVDYRTDIWSVGVLLYELLCGERPFIAEMDAAVLYTVLNMDHVPISSMREGVPESVIRIVNKTLAKDREQRYQDATELIEDLRVAALWPDDGSGRILTSASKSRLPSKPSSGIRSGLKASAEAIDGTNLMILMQKVHQFWIEGVLEHSVHGEAMLQLGMERARDVVEHPWEQVLELPDRESTSLSDSTKIGTVFDDVGRSLLVLGAPGSGKTITLLELAKSLITTAENDPSQPIPVVFNLSSWAIRRQSLLDWLSGELSAKYHVPKKIGRSWLKQNRLILPLDGLDEVMLEHRSSCVHSINEYVEEFGVPGLTVCCRIEEYTALPIRLKLFAAVRLQPLDRHQVLEYVSHSGQSLVGLHEVLQREESLQEMATSPLVLDVMILAYRDVDADTVLLGVSEESDSQRTRLFTTYIRRMLSRKGKSDSTYTEEETVSWLTWMAERMLRHGQTTFAIEELQFSWLATRAQKWTYALTSRMLGVLLAGFIFLNDPNAPFYWLSFILLFGMAIGLIDGSRIDANRFFRELCPKVVYGRFRQRVVLM